MSTTRLREGFVLAALGALLGGCAVDSGPVRTVARQVEAFHAIELRGAAEMQVEVGKGPALTITAGERVIEAITTEVQGGVLVIRVRDRGGWFRQGQAARMSVQAPALDSIDINGAGEFQLRDVSGEKLDIRVKGAGSIQASGRVGRLTARIDGAASADLGQLVTSDAEVAVNGAGSLDVNVTGTLTAEVNGVGSVSYAGNPQKVVPSVRGVGSISPAAGK